MEKEYDGYCVDCCYWEEKGSALFCKKYGLCHNDDFINHGTYLGDNDIPDEQGLIVLLEDEKYFNCISTGAYFGCKKGKLREDLL